MAYKGTRFDVKVYLKAIGVFTYDEDVSSGSGVWGMDWIEPAQDSSDRWWALVTAVMNLRVQ
jgi:hypothetical protein